MAVSSKDNPDSNGPERLSAILQRTFQRTINQNPAPIQNYKIWEVWGKVVGGAIAKHSRPQSFRHGRLFVGVSHPTWVTELSFRREELKKRLNEELGKKTVHRIIFRLDSMDDK